MGTDQAGPRSGAEGRKLTSGVPTAYRLLGFGWRRTGEIKVANNVPEITYGVPGIRRG
jgi:hypothetical protein